MKIQELQAQLSELEASKAALFEQGSVDQVQVSRLNEQMKAVQSQIAAAQQEEELQQVSEQVAEKQTEYAGGLKEVIYQVFESVLPKETGHKLIGINEYEEIAQSFRQMVDLAVEENNTALYAFIGEQIEAKDNRLRELTAQNIDLDAKLQESIRKEQSAQENYERALSENERIEQENVRLANVSAEKDVQLAEVDEQLKAKDEQIAKLTSELNKPAQIILPNQARPSQSLAEMMQAAKEKSVKSQLDIVLAGNTHRGPVLITPPSVGGSEGQDSFRIEDTQTNVEDYTVPAPEVAPVEALPTLPIGLELDEGDVHGEVVTKTLEERVKALEIAVFGKAEVAA